MTEEGNARTPDCMFCHCGSEERPLIAVLSKGKEGWVCVGCLPMLIHGAH